MCWDRSTLEKPVNILAKNVIGDTAGDRRAALFVDVSRQSRRERTVSNRERQGGRFSTGMARARHSRKPTMKETPLVAVKVRRDPAAHGCRSYRDRLIAAPIQPDQSFREPIHSMFLAAATRLAARQ